MGKHTAKICFVLLTLISLQQKGWADSSYYTDHCNATWYNCAPFCALTEAEVYASALYWRPSFDGVQYATINEGPSFQGVPVFVEPESRWGYRIGARIGLYCDYYVESNFTYFRTGNTDSVTAPGAILAVFAPVLSDFDSASARIDSKYQAVDIFGGFRWMKCVSGESNFFAGARYFRIKEKESFVYSDPNDTGFPVAQAFQRYSLTGWGPRIGAEVLVAPFNCSILRCLKVNSHIAVMAGLADRTNLMESEAQSGVFPQGALAFPDRFTTVLGTDFSLELIYTLNICCFAAEIKGGYELNYYSNARKRIDITNTLGIAPRSTSALGYGGPYIELSVIY